MSTDRALIRQIAAGSADAFDTLFDRYETQVRQKLMSVVKNKTAAEDLLQEVFLRLWTRGHQWKGTGTVKGWLMRVATNLALNYLRSVKRRRSQPLESRGGSDEDQDSKVLERMIDETHPGPDQALEEKEKWSEMWALVDALPDHQREVIRMVHEMEMDVLEAATQLGIPSGTVKSRLHYARKTLTKEWHDMKWQHK